MTTNMTQWKLEDHLQTAEQQRLFLEAAFEEAGDDSAYIAQAIGAVARARGMTTLARETGLAREALYRSFSPKGNPNLATVMKVTQALGFKLTLTPVRERARSCNCDVV